MPVVEGLELGRACCARGAWLEAHRALAAADDGAPLGPDDLELLATAAYMLGRVDEYVLVLERAHRAWLDAGAPLRATRNAFRSGWSSCSRGRPRVRPGGSAAPSGWWSRDRTSAAAA